MATTYIQSNFSGTGSSTGAKATYSVWVKNSVKDDRSTIISGRADGGSYMKFRFANDQLALYGNHSSSNNVSIETNRKFRDPNAWLHIVLQVDTTHATSTERVKIFVNGVQETSFANSTYPAQNAPLYLTKEDDVQVGAYNNTEHFDGCMSHFYCIDGTIYAPTVFAETDATDGMWKAKPNPTVTYGSKGWLIFKDSANLSGSTVSDQSTNSNDFTVATGTLTDTKDNPDNNFATWQPLQQTTGQTAPTFLNGNTFLQAASNTPRNYGVSTLAMPRSGKYFSEHKIVENNDCIQFGIVSTHVVPNRFHYNTPFSSTTEGMMFVCPEGKIEYNNANEITGLTTAGNNDIVGLGVDMDNEKLYIYVNGALVNSGGTSFASKVTGQYVYMATGDGTTSGNDSVYSNFGNGYFGTTKITSAGTNSSYGDFEYNLPASGWGALCTKQINS